MKFFKWLDVAIQKVSSFLLVVTVFSMLILSLLIILLRWFDLTVIWFEPMVRHLVFLTIFLGGTIATGRKTHIGIDIVGKYLEKNGNFIIRRVIRIIVAIASLVTLVMLIISSVAFFNVESIYGKDVFLGIHSRFMVLIIPIGFSLMAYRFFYLLLESISPTAATKGDI